MSFTVNDLEEWTSSDAAEKQEFYWGELEDGYESYDTPWGKMDWVETEREYDEGRQNLEMIFTVGGDRFFQKNGYYDSWAGGAWDGALTEVRPREKMVTVYEAI